MGLSYSNTTKPLLATTDWQVKSQYQEWITSFRVASQRSPIDPSIVHLITIALGYLPEFDGKTLLLKTLQLSYKTERNQAGTDLRLSSLLVNFHSARRYHACYQGRQGIISLKTVSKCSYKIASLGRYAFLCNSGTNVMSNQTLSDWI